MKSLRLFAAMLLCSYSLADQKHPKTSDITYYLYTRSNSNNGEIIHYTDQVINSLFEGSRKTYVLVHGFAESFESSTWMQTTKNLILGKDNGNVILVDWGTLSADPRYDLSVSNSNFVGEDLSFLLQDLSVRGGLVPGNVHLIGFSLSAQVVGVTGNKYGQVDRITGLDPAAPLFEDKPLTDKLDKGDAKFVDIIHTNSGHLVTGHLSFFEAIGHVDFYPNGGHDQRGCPPLVEEVVDSLEDLSFDDIDACSHSRAPEYFIESLKENDFFGYRCTSYEKYQNGLCTTNSNILGWNAQRKNEGAFYMETLVGEPFVASQIKAEFTVETSTKGSLTLKNTIPGLAQDEFIIFGGRDNVLAGSVVTNIITSSSGGVMNMGIVLVYDSGRSSSKSMKISSINSVDIRTGDEVCIGRDITLISGQNVTVSPTSGPC